MKNRFLLLFALLMLGLALCLSACKEEQHIHAFTE